MRPLAVWLPRAAMLLGTLVLGLSGIERSLWLDEAWVANSVREPSLWGMFHYSEWLQTSPPLFLLIARAAVGMFGLSVVTLRAVPFGFALAVAAGMPLVLRRMVGWPVAVLATAVLMFSPTSIEHFRSFKQYSGEVTATVATLYITIRYLQSDRARDFAWLCGGIGVLLTLSYPLVFLIPGIVLAVWKVGGLARAGVLAGIVAAVEGGLYWFFIRSNIAPNLWTFWDHGWRDVWSGSTFLAALLCGMVAVRLGLGTGQKLIRRQKNDVRGWIAVVCLLPCVSFLIAEVAGLYPTDPRMRLFLWPCVLLLAAMFVDELFGWVQTRLEVHANPVFAYLLLVGAVVITAWGTVKTFNDHQGKAFEDYAAAVRVLRQKMAPEDLLLVHADAREGFVLQTAMDPWPEQDWRRQTRFGSTGWPCCARGHDAGPGSGKAEAVIADLDRMVPSGFHGRVWLLYANRPLHWKYLGLDEGDLWRRILWERGCPPSEYFDLGNVVLSPMSCGSAK